MIEEKKISNGHIRGNYWQHNDDAQIAYFCFCIHDFLNSDQLFMEEIPFMISDGFSLSKENFIEIKRKKESQIPNDLYPMFDAIETFFEKKGKVSVKFVENYQAQRLEEKHIYKEWEINVFFEKSKFGMYWREEFKGDLEKIEYYYKNDLKYLALKYIEKISNSKNKYKSLKVTKHISGFIRKNDEIKKEYILMRFSEMDGEVKLRKKVSDFNKTKSSKIIDCEFTEVDNSFLKEIVTYFYSEITQHIEERNDLSNFNLFPKSHFILGYILNNHNKKLDKVSNVLLDEKVLTNYIKEFISYLRRENDKKNITWKK